ncbi:hypothetical protein C0992_003681, partial [Termitomyces sp. T32_za158]
MDTSGSNPKKRYRNDRDAAISNPSPKKRGILPDSLKKGKLDIYHIKKKDIPDDAAGFK